MRKVICLVIAMSLFCSTAFAINAMGSPKTRKNITHPKGR